VSSLVIINTIHCTEETMLLSISMGNWPSNFGTKDWGVKLSGRTEGQGFYP
jgi:hypothetical protein